MEKELEKVEEKEDVKKTPVKTVKTVAKKKAVTKSKPKPKATKPVQAKTKTPKVVVPKETVAKTVIGEVETVPEPEYTLTITKKEYRMKDVVTLLKLREDGELQVHLKFDGEDLIYLTPEVIQNLYLQEKVNYKLNKDYADEKIKTEANADDDAPKVKVLRQLRPLNGGIVDKIKKWEAKCPPGFHMCFKREDEVADSLRIGYKRMGIATHFEGKVELVAMIIPEKRFQEHLRAVEQASKDRKDGVIRDFEGTVKKNANVTYINQSRKGRMRHKK